MWAKLLPAQFARAVNLRRERLIVLLGVGLHLSGLTWWGLGCGSGAPGDHVLPYGPASSTDAGTDGDAAKQEPRQQVAAKVLVSQGGLVKLEYLSDTLNLVAVPRIGELRLTHRDTPLPLLSSDEEPWTVALVPPVPRHLSYIGLHLGVNIGAELAERSSTMPRVSAPPASSSTSPSSGLLEVTVEDNRLYFPNTPGDEHTDHWYWKYLPPHFSLENTVFLPAPPAAGFPAAIEVELNAVMATGSGEYHSAEIVVNNAASAQVQWTGMGATTVQFAIPPSVLVAGDNSVAFEVLEQGSPENGCVLFNSITVRYQAMLEISAGQSLCFCLSGSPGTVAVATPYEPPVIVMFDEPVAPQQIVDAESQPWGSGWLTRFEGEAHCYCAAEPTDLPVLEQFEELEAEDPFSSVTGAQWVAIAHNRLVGPAQTLCAHREKQGLSCAVFTIEQVQDRFAGSDPDPNAINSFLTFASEHWQPAPRYVVFMGDASYDRVGYKDNSAEDLVPAPQIKTSYKDMLTAGDNAYATTNWQDGVSVALGRIPARTMEQANSYVARVIYYETSGASACEHDALLVADDDEPTFVSHLDTLGQILPNTTSVRLLLPSEWQGSGDPASVVWSELSQGYRTVIYSGHGDWTTWGAEGLLKAEAVAAAPSPACPSLVLVMSCLNGAFDHPTITTLAETMLLEPGMAIGVWASSGMTFPSAQLDLFSAMLNSWVGVPDGRIGDAVLAGINLVAPALSAEDVLKTWIYFGDPATLVEP